MYESLTCVACAINSRQPDKQCSVIILTKSRRSRVSKKQQNYIFLKFAHGDWNELRARKFDS